jgi:hypothetical protein
VDEEVEVEKECEVIERITERARARLVQQDGSVEQHRVEEWMWVG